MTDPRVKARWIDKEIDEFRKTIEQHQTEIEDYPLTDTEEGEMAMLEALAEELE